MAMGNRRQPAAINRKNMDFKVLGRVLGYMTVSYTHLTLPTIA